MSAPGLPAALEIAGRTIRFTKAERPLFPTGETKGDLLRYLLEIGPVLLRHLEGRPVTLVRYPDGVEAKGFFQKHRPDHAPAWTDSVVLGGTRYLLAHTPADLALYAQWAAVEIHAPLCRVQDGRLLAPDELVIDLDPMPPAGWREVQRAAHGVRTLLDAMGVRGYPKTSGQTGLHVYIPVRPGAPSKDLESLVKGLGRLLEQAAPDLYTTVWQVKRRHGIYVDYGQNAPGHTMAAPYTVRATAGAQVSTPIRWEELPDICPADFTIHTVPERVRREGDLFAPVLGPPQPLEALRDAAQTLIPSRTSR